MVSSKGKKVPTIQTEISFQGQSLDSCFVVSLEESQNSFAEYSSCPEYYINLHLFQTYLLHQFISKVLNRLSELP
jgi:hypothetical protein